MGLCNFVEIVGSWPTVHIGDEGPKSSAVTTWSERFDLPNLDPEAPAFLIFNVRMLTTTDRMVPVLVNLHSAGSIRPYGGDRDTAGWFFTQMIALPVEHLKEKDNEIMINAIGWDGEREGNLYDNFVIKNVYCFYHVR